MTEFLLISSNFQEFETVQHSKYKKRPNLNQKNVFPRIIDYEKPTKKEERKKKATFQNPASFFFVGFS